MLKETTPLQKMPKRGFVQKNGLALVIQAAWALSNLVFMSLRFVDDPDSRRYLTNWTVMFTAVFFLLDVCLELARHTRAPLGQQTYDGLAMFWTLVLLPMAHGLSWTILLIIVIGYLDMPELMPDGSSMTFYVVYDYAVHVIPPFVLGLYTSIHRENLKQSARLFAAKHTLLQTIGLLVATFALTLAFLGIYTLAYQPARVYDAYITNSAMVFGASLPVILFTQAIVYAILLS